MIMSSNERLTNVRSRYTQLFLSSWSDFGKPENQDDDSTQKELAPPEITSEFFKQKKYLLLVPIIIEPTDISDTEYSYTIQVPTHFNLSLSPFGRTGKRMSKQVLNIPGETVQDKVKISMVYGVLPPGKYPLSHTSGTSLGQAVTYIFGSILGNLDRAIKCFLQQQKDQAGIDDTGSGSSSTLPQKSLGEHQEERRIQALRDKIRIKTVPENSPVVDENDGTILG